MTGNWLARIYQAVFSADHGSGAGKSNLITPSSSSLRIKVRMTRTQLKELMRQAGSSHGNSELGSMILREMLRRQVIKSRRLIQRRVAGWVG
ncbi:hypothetical protein OIU74_007702 [Salix koriyanagi]|uniref:Uncharacterized protein n=1 Tax=Salix koriyanagi TaxID=2511006 RepID=A0A9Q0U461_9ROSI|nr:hypothetical protein OIU74_007702 [Salix koriyanagi]